MRLTPLILLLFGLPLVACDGGDKATAGDDDDSTGDDDDDDDDDDNDDDNIADFGLEERPSNGSCVAPSRPPNDADIELNRVFSNVSPGEAIWAGMAPGSSDWWYVAQQNGTISRFDANDQSATLQFLYDAPSQGGGEMGLLGMAFHPDFASNGEVFLSYTRNSPRRSVIARIDTTGGGATWDGSSLDVILEVSQPYSNHNGGHIAFGHDGHLYIGLGDGGSANDPQNHAQNTDDLLGTILRIDVDGTAPYSIPADNPFASGGGEPEIYAWGLRNPWRFSFDRQTGEMWAGDVGQNQWEEVDYIELGGNYGWKNREGSHCFSPPCNKPGIIDPIAEYDHSQGASVTGGVVYRGSGVPDLVGVYLYTDFYTGRLWGLFYDEVTGEPDPRQLMSTGRTAGHFAEDNDGEVYLLDYYGGLYKIDEASAQTSTFPELLSETGCVDPSDPSETMGMIPYDVALPFWSDGADKDRWLAIPDGETITVDADGNWVLPIGSVTLKHFRINNALVETRLMVRHDDGEWAGYSYAWSGNDAAWAKGGKTVQAGGADWTIPSSAACLQCHTAAAGRTLGLETGQLDSLGTYPSTGLTANQIDTLVHVGVLDDEPDRGDVFSPTDARHYLHVNCSQCHRDGGPMSEIDLRFTQDLADTNICDVDATNDLGVNGAKRVEPGNGDASVLLQRMSALDAGRMPPVGSAVVDDDGVDLIRAWIDGLSDCN